MTVIVKGSARVRIYAPTGRMLVDVTPPAGSVFTAYYGVTWSPDGKWLGLKWERGLSGTTGCCRAGYLLIHSNGRGRRTLFRTYETAHDLPFVSWSPNGKWLTWTAGRVVKRLRLRDALPPAWSLNGRLIAFPRRSNVLTVPAGGGKPKVAVRLPRDWTPLALEWSR